MEPRVEPAPARPEGRTAAGGIGQRLAGALRRVRDRVPGLGVFTQAVVNYIRHQSGNQAGSVAFSSVVAMFPLLLFVAAAAAFIGKPGTAAELAGRVVEFTPPFVSQSLKPVIDDVLGQRSRALVAIGLLVTIWAASSGTQAIRTALNRAYGVERGLSFWAARLKVIVFTVIGTVVGLVIFSSVVILPYAWALLRDSGADAESPWLRDAVRYGLAFVVVVVLYTAFYAWLPDIRQRFSTVLPGAIAGAAMWLGAAAVLSSTLRSAGKLTLVYGGFAGAIATLVFLYIVAATLIFGAEINGVLRSRREGALGR